MCVAVYSEATGTAVRVAAVAEVRRGDDGNPEVAVVVPLVHVLEEWIRGKMKKGGEK